MKKLILILIVLFSISCQKEEVIQEPVTKTVTYNVTGNRLFYVLTIADENGDPYLFQWLTESQSITVTAKINADVFMEYESRGSSEGTELEILVNGKRVDYWKGNPGNYQVIFLND